MTDMLYTEYFDARYSEVIKKVYYDKVSKNLYVVYREHGSVYGYGQVEHPEYLDFYRSPSRGRHLNEVVKSRYQRLGYLGRESVLNFLVRRNQATELEKAEAKVDNKYKYEVFFEQGGKEKSHTLEAGSVNEVLTTLDEWSKVFGLDFKAKRATVYFE